jgi:hypothetical protein
VNKKSKQNRYRPDADKSIVTQSDSESNFDFCIKCIMTVACISILSLASIFAHDFVTQSAFFNIKQVEISGHKRVLKNDILELANLNRKDNIFQINLYSIEKLIVSHPWIKSAQVKRDLTCKLTISIIEQEPLAIVKIENLADILINTQGAPFKEYNPQEDRIENIPVISGLDLTQKNNEYMFESPLFNSIMNFLETNDSDNIIKIIGDKNIGIAIEANDIYNRLPSGEKQTLKIKLGFDNFAAKLKKAKKISEYIDKNFPERAIFAMDLFNIEKVFIKTTLNNALHHNLEKGV